MRTRKNSICGKSSCNQFYRLFEYFFFFEMLTLRPFEDAPIKCQKLCLQYIEFIFRRTWEKIKSEFSFFYRIGLQASKICMFFGKCIGKEVLKLFSGRNNYPQPPIFGFSNSISYGLEKSRELRRLIS